MDEFLREHGFKESADSGDIMEAIFTDDDTYLLDGLGLEAIDFDSLLIQCNTRTGDVTLYLDGEKYDEIAADDLACALEG